MNAHLSYMHDRSSTFDPPPVLVAATSDEARARAINIVKASGLRLAAAISIDDVPDRLSAQRECCSDDSAKQAVDGQFVGARDVGRPKMALSACE